MVYSDLHEDIRTEIENYVDAWEWKFVLKEYNWMVRIKKKFPYSMVTMNIYWNKKMRFKVCTIMNHPKRGKNQMFRAINNLEELNKFLENPRLHSGKGYGSNKNKNGKSI